MIHNIQIKNQAFVLHCSGVVFWQEQNMLLVSDVHIGKVSHFRKYGMAVPEAAIFENFNRLREVCGFFNPGRIVFLGDLFHSKINNEWHLFSAWAKESSAEITLVEGNHDIIARRNYTDLGIQIFQELEIGGFLLTHIPEKTEGFFNFCGHIHPGIYLRGMGRQSLKLRCFFQTKDQMVLPAFGEFTGNFYIAPEEGDIVYAITGNEVLLVS